MRKTAGWLSHRKGRRENQNKRVMRILIQTDGGLKFGLREREYLFRYMDPYRGPV